MTACCMRSLSISLKRHSQTNKSGPQRNKHVHRLVPSTPSCTGYVHATGCHQLPTLAALHSSLPPTGTAPHTPFPRHVCRHTRQLAATNPTPR